MKSINNMLTPKKEENFEQINELFLYFRPIKKLQVKNIYSSIINADFDNKTKFLNSTKKISSNVIQLNSNHLKNKLLNNNQIRNCSLIISHNVKSQYNYKNLVQSINKYLKSEKKNKTKENLYFRKRLYNILNKYNIKQLVIKKDLKSNSYNSKNNNLKKEISFSKDLIPKKTIKKNHKCNFFNLSNDNFAEIKIINKETNKKETLSLSDTYNSFNRESKIIENTVFGKKMLSDKLIHKNFISRDFAIKQNINKIFNKKLTNNICLRNNNNFLFYNIMKKSGNSNSVDYIYNCYNKNNQKMNNNFLIKDKYNSDKNFPRISKNSILNSYIREKIFNE